MTEDMSEKMPKDISAKDVRRYVRENGNKNVRRNIRKMSEKNGRR